MKLLLAILLLFSAVVSANTKIAVNYNYKYLCKTPGEIIKVKEGQGRIIHPELYDDYTCHYNILMLKTKKILKNVIRNPVKVDASKGGFGQRITSW